MVYEMNCMGSAQLENRDAVRSRTAGDFCALALADGVSAGCASGEGAAAVCDAALDFLLQENERLFSLSGEALAAELCDVMWNAVCKLAVVSGLRTGEYASTAVCVLYRKSTRQLLYFSLGDSLILGIRETGASILAMPCDSRWGIVSTTSPRACRSARAGVLENVDYRAVLLCSDGAWHCMYAGSRLTQNMQRLLTKQDFAGLKDALCACKPADDCSFVSLALPPGERRPA